MAVVHLNILAAKEILVFEAILLDPTDALGHNRIKVLAWMPLLPAPLVAMM